MLRALFDNLSIAYFTVLFCVQCSGPLHEEISDAAIDGSNECPERCPEGELCRDGECRSVESLCEFVLCPSGQQCTWDSASRPILVRASSART